jgi:hypothetical protein
MPSNGVAMKESVAAFRRATAAVVAVPNARLKTTLKM